MRGIIPLIENMICEFASNDVATAAKRTQDLDTRALVGYVSLVAAARDGVLAVFAEQHREEAGLVHVAVHGGDGDEIGAAGLGVAALDAAEGALGVLVLGEMLRAAGDEDADEGRVLRVAEAAVAGGAGALGQVLLEVRDESGAVLAALGLDGDGRRRARIAGKNGATAAAGSRNSVIIVIDVTICRRCTCGTLILIIII